MAQINLADAKARLSELVSQAEAGETICIARRGKPVAMIAPARHTRKPIDFDALRALTDTLPRQPESAGALVRSMRDGDRF